MKYFPCKRKGAQVFEVHNSIDSRNVLLKRPRLLIIYMCMTKFCLIIGPSVVPSAGAHLLLCGAQ